MSATILSTAITFALGALALAMIFATIRILRGPRAQDRVLGLDTLYVNTMLLFLTLGIRNGTVFFLSLIHI